MSRRRLRVVCSSDEEDEEPHPPPPPPPPPPPTQQQEVEEIDNVILDDIEIDFQTVTLNSSNPTPNSYNSTTANAERIGSRSMEPIPIDISDDELENIINSDATNVSSFDNATGNNGHFEVSESPVNGVLESLGLRLKKEWLNSCLHGLQSAVPGFQGMDASAKAKLCFGQFLCSDMNYCGAGVLPPNVNALHLVDLKGPFVLQVDELVNISCPLRGRYQNATTGIRRCLKLSMTDGVQRVFGMEYRPIKDLEVLAPAGLKVVVSNVNIRHGMLMLVPEVLEVLGGTVEELAAARQRLVNEINKPPRGKSVRNRTGELPPLATRATRAAWLAHTDAVPGHADRNTTTPPLASGQGAAVSAPANDMHGQARATPLSRSSAEPNSSAAAWPHEHDEVRRHTNITASTPLRVAGQGTAFGIHANDKPREDFRVPVSRSNAQPTTLSAVQPLERVTIPQNIDEHMTEFMTPSTAARQVTPPDIPANYMPEEISVSRDAETSKSSTVHMDVEEMSMEDELEHHFILSRDIEIPFTYLASLSAKCAAIENEASAVRGKIKCFLTGVKGFQFKQRATYELRVYVDDGSLISEILIDHNVVRRFVGYSPQEVTSALASSENNRSSEMRKTMRQFQMFLFNFEGTMVVEMNKAASVPVAVEMNEGCPASDAWLLLKRLKSFSSAQPRNLPHLNTIDLSP